MKFIFSIKGGFIMEKLQVQLDKHKASVESQIATPLLVELDADTQDLRASGIESSSYTIGDYLPDAQLLNHLQEPVSLYKLIQGKPAIIKFYRGAWCPYCNLELQAYNQQLQQQPDIPLFAISPEKADQGIHIDNLGFTVLTDENNQFAEKLKLVFTLGENTSRIYEQFGIDLQKSQGNDENRLPIPATFVIDSSGKIVFAHVDADYTKRADIDEVFASYHQVDQD